VIACGHVVPAEVTTSISFELTKYQSNQLKALGHTVWPNQNLPRAEISRRVLLDAADQRLATVGDGRLLEACCTPSQKLSKT
jgi:hypothetical protein